MNTWKHVMETTVNDVPVKVVVDPFEWIRHLTPEQKDLVLARNAKIAVQRMCRAHFEKDGAPEFNRANVQAFYDSVRYTPRVTLSQEEKDQLELIRLLKKKGKTDEEIQELLS